MTKSSGLYEPFCKDESVLDKAYEDVAAWLGVSATDYLDILGAEGPSIFDRLKKGENSNARTP